MLLILFLSSVGCGQSVVSASSFRNGTRVHSFDELLFVSH